MGMFRTLVGSRAPQKYRKYFNLPERQDSWCIPGSRASVLGEAAAAWLADKDELCGVYRLQFGLDALCMRIGLIEQAQYSVDIQSYLVKDDLSGNLIAMKLVEAANRGVRVRLLMDDALTEPIDSGLLSLNEHVNIEVRVFNPFPRRRSRLISFVANFNILNRRMHNKSFTVDNSVTIVGGRNLADEYYQTRGGSQFLDEDLVAIGSIVQDVSRGFDRYWNTPEAIPISVFDKHIEHPTVNEIIAEGRRYLEERAGSPLLAGLNDRLVMDLLSGTLPLLAAPAELVMDVPEKVRWLVHRQVGEVTRYLVKMVSTATRELIIVSPYFVPQRQGVDFFSAMVKKGVRVIIVTNSLASTNHESVHAVYARYRKPLLRQGVELYELCSTPEPDAGEEDSTDLAPLTLHSKVAVVDRTRLFVGSFNLDPRSFYINTEMGMVVDGPQMAASLASTGLESLRTTAYRLRLNKRGGLTWHLAQDGSNRVVSTEPDTSFWRRLRTKLMGLLPIEGQM
jgi:putative cardiolipin synthase